MRIVLEVQAPIEMAQCIKEILAMDMERIGLTKVLDIQDDGWGQQQDLFRR